ncbi:Detected protein of confused Function [Hibiscus syriacus]|uniref:Detected protein of confused Function n=1 Tax=Hibiscus syriacus TaxID=106335 RepID=A0A6A3AZM8_HIBSY|nr:cytochrome P450 CYP82D47-like [Hibiscus syriacus]KAE8709343.1 Detected protein of confused Function [Hibiscus syriacus]
MDFSSYLPAIFGSFIGLLIAYYIWRQRHKHDEGKLLAPEVSGSLLIIGHLHLLGAQPTLARTLASMADKYGPVFMLRFGLFPTLIVGNHEAVKECLTTNDRALATRPPTYAGKYMAYDHAGFGFAPYGPFWREMRKFTMVELLSTHKLAKSTHVRDWEVKALMKDLYTFFNKPNQTISMDEKLEVFTLNMVLGLVAGKRYFSNAEGVDDKEAHRVMKIYKQFSYLMGVKAISEVVPFLKWTDKWSWQVKAMKRASQEMNHLVESWVDEHIAKGIGNGSNQHQDFIDVMLSAIDDEMVFGHTRDKVIKATTTTLISAGSDTTSVSMTWILANLMNNKHALERAQEELDLKIGRERWVQESDMEKLVYLKAIVKETFRLHPAAPILVPHEAMEDCRVSGYHIPKGTRLIVNIWKLHRDPRVWSNPEEFQPERFLTTHEKVDIWGQFFELIPFGSGRRSCPGITLALQVIHLTIASLLQGFDLNTPLNAPVDMSEGTSFNLPKSTPLELVLTPRLPSHLYQI